MSNEYISELFKYVADQANPILHNEDSIELYTDIINTWKSLSQKLILDPAVSRGNVHLSAGTVDVPGLKNTIDEKADKFAQEFLNITFNSFMGLISEAYNFDGQRYKQEYVVKADLFNMLWKMLAKWFEHQASFFRRIVLPKLDKYPKDLTNKQIQSLTNLLDGSPYIKATLNFDLNECAIWGRMDDFIRRDVRFYTIRAVTDRKTCPVCIRMSGSSWKVEYAVEWLHQKASTDVKDLRGLFKFPTEADLDVYNDVSNSPYPLPPYHLLCRCYIVES